MKNYNHKEIEPKWQRKWSNDKLYEVKDQVKGPSSAKASAGKKENFYQLVEFPYPSGNLHVGHWYAFSVPDIFVRAKRMQGFNVLYPMGFDAFGLPAENAAIKNNLSPRKWTEGNIEYMREQMETMGTSFDWSREVSTTDPEYYRWTQWMFLEFFKNGLAYQGETFVNWCPSCKTVLANEQVVQGVCERCSSEVEQKVMKQWHLRISEYAEDLLNDLEDLDWPEAIKEGQRNWIGRSEGALIEFPISNFQFPIRVFTTRPDTIYGATYMVLAPESKLVQELADRISNSDEVQKYVKQAGRKTELQRMAEGKNKTGVELKGVKAVNPATREEIPVWVADYVLGSVGTGAIMAVPAHDVRDNEFAKKYKLRIKQVVKPAGVVDEPVQLPSPAAWGHVDADIEADVWTGDGQLINSGEFNGKESNEAREAIANKFGKTETQYRMRDWIISRQRYWGVPIPLVFCENCAGSIKNQVLSIKNTKRQLTTELDGKTVAIIPIPEKELPVELPELKDFKPDGSGKSPLARAEKWVEVKCPECGEKARRETDTIDTFVDSSWYFLRYLDPKNSKKFADEKKLKAWMPVDRYSGGAEHTTMHLLYSRFWIKALHKLGHLPWSEPYKVRMNRSLILGPDGHKMSKSRGNVVDPDEVVEELGADTVRMYLAFIGPYNEVNTYPWDPKGIQGIRRFLEKVWKMYDSVTLERSDRVSRDSIGSTSLQNDNIGKLHKLIKKVTADIEAFKFNTAIAAMMEFVNELRVKSQELSTADAQTFLKLLAPFAPHMTEEIWQNMHGHTRTELRQARKSQKKSVSSQFKSVHNEPWPKYDEKLIKDEKVKIPVQINGKVRATIEVASDVSEDEVRKLAESDEKVQKYLNGKEIKKFVYVEGKIIYFVTK